MLMLDNEHFGLIISMFFSITLSFLLIYIYKNFSLSLYKRKNFEQNFLIIAPVITLLIFVVKSNLALSLGLVGALSIIRYRTAIKDPEEIAYLFICVAIGVGTGASFNFYTFIATIILMVVIVFNYKRNPNKIVNQHFILEIRSNNLKNKLQDLLIFIDESSNNIIRKLHINDKGDYQLVFEITQFKNNINATSISGKIKLIVKDAQIDITSINNDIENI